jgi:hypothetical protein
MKKTDDLSEDDYEAFPGTEGVDYKASPDDVLSLVDDQLAAFGLEIEMFDTGGDEYAWRIIRKEASP